jgi:hypothetical protein
MDVRSLYFDIMLVVLASINQSVNSQQLCEAVSFRATVNRGFGDLGTWGRGDVKTWGLGDLGTVIVNITLLPTPYSLLPITLSPRLSLTSSISFLYHSMSIK